MSEYILDYLSKLEDNNTKKWYQDNLSYFQDAMNEYEQIVCSLISEIGKEDPSILHNEPKNMIFDLVRDVRFSADKSPYSPAFRCHISVGGKMPVPTGYYLCISPKNRSYLGCGLFADIFEDATARVRDYINEHPEEFLSIINQPDFKRMFQLKGSIGGSFPKKYSADNPWAEYLQYKSWYIEYHFSDALLKDDKSFIKYAFKRFMVMKPFHDFINRALTGFMMPLRTHSLSL